ncbi:ABC transporter ATP-binding protein [Kistimonas asteriae]|uniref:ABC transporter ATP-binding protein n=1 Tax=Kistimonas asteriae TaxID=517724 RepID=UPI001BA6F84D|nr:ABC transporter ATP-binding protein [Kistimonas asteriae]
MSDPLIELKHLVKVYPPATLALNDVSVTINAGEIHSVIGENGAGKSTLMKVLYGINSINGGGMWYCGQQVAFRNPMEAVAAGIGMVHQEFMLVPSYSIYENVVLGMESVKHSGRWSAGILNRQKDRDAVQAIADQYALNLRVTDKVEDLSVAAQQKVEILKLLYRDVDVLIMDEPTAVLTPQEIRQLFERLKTLRDHGKTVVFISHKLDEVLALSDTITVMRKGQHIRTFRNTPGLTKADLARAMVGRDVVFAIDKAPAAPGDVVFEMELVEARDSQEKLRLHEISLQVHAGEIVGLAGVEGNGQFELVQAMTGQATVAAGRIYLSGQDITDWDIRSRRRLMSYVPQDRKISGSSLKSSLIDNAVMTHHYSNPSLGNGMKGLLSRSRCREFTQQLMQHFGVVAAGPETAIGDLSGGNQQKVIVGREFELDNHFIILDQPTRGLDVGSIEYIQQRIVEKRDAGAGCFLISADLDELFSLSDRILVIYEGSIVADLNPADVTREQVGEYMLGSREKAA